MVSSLDRLLKLLAGVAFLVAAIIISGCVPPTPTPLPAPTPTPVVDDDVGLALAVAAANETERRLARETGAGWDRFPMWWHEVQIITGELRPEIYDGTLANEPLKNVLAVLTSRYPGAVGLDSRCVALVRAKEADSKYWDGQYGFCVTYTGYDYDYEYEKLVRSEPPLLADGTPNPNNPWAMFIYHTSQHHRHRVNGWEIFNEHEAGFASGWDPACNCETDQKYFYLPPPAVYVQLIRDAITVIRATNPGEPIVLGGAWQADAQALVQGNAQGWYAQVLRILNKTNTDDLLTGVGLHAYGQPKLSYELISGLQITTPLPFWLTETGLHFGEPDPATGNCLYPPSGQPCGSEEEMASYIVQQHVWALKAFHDTGRPGKVFHFSFKDVDLPWGLLQGDGTRREGYDAFQFIVRALYNATYEGYERKARYARMIFRRGDERISVLWATTGDGGGGCAGPFIISAAIRAAGPGAFAFLYDQRGTQVNRFGSSSDRPIQAGRDGYYHIWLPGATHPMVVIRETDERMVGGRTFILIEPLNLAFARNRQGPRSIG